MVLSWYGTDGFVPVWYHGNTDSGDFHKTSAAYFIAYSTALGQSYRTGLFSQHIIFFVSYEWIR
jgi:hypothetical protein